MATTNGDSHQSEDLIKSIAHINLIVPRGTLDQAKDFYGNTLGLKPRPVPHLKTLWPGDTGLDPGDCPAADVRNNRFDISNSGQQVHVAYGPDEAKSPRHPCFRLGSPEALLELRQRIWDHHQKGGDSAPQEADAPGAENSGSKGVEYPQRFFARDYAGNRLEFSL